MNELTCRQKDDLVRMQEELANGLSNHVMALSFLTWLRDNEITLSNAGEATDEVLATKYAVHFLSPAVRDAAEAAMKVMRDKVVPPAKVI